MKTTSTSDFESSKARPTGLVVKSIAVAFLILALCWTLPAQQTNSNEGGESAGLRSLGACQIFGHNWGIDLLGGQMFVKSPSGDIGALRFDKTTLFKRASLNASPPAAPTRLTPEAVSEGDWICAWVHSDNSDVPTSPIMFASEVLVASRLEIDRQQREDLAEWLKSGAFGTVVKLDPAESSFILEYALAGGERGNLRVDVGEATRFRRYRPDADDLSEAKPASWAQVRVGEMLYARGKPNADRTSL